MNPAYPGPKPIHILNVERTEDQRKRHRSVDRMLKAHARVAEMKEREGEFIISEYEKERDKLTTPEAKANLFVHTMRLLQR